jgi:hypothetical protein
VLPSALLPALHLLSELHQGRYLVVLAQGREAGPPAEANQLENEHPKGFLKLVQALDDIQRVSGV